MAAGAADDGGFLAEDLGFEDVRRVFLHPLADEILRLAEEEFDALA